MDEKTVSVSWYTCDCAETSWITKYCDEHHRAHAVIPLSVLEQYREGETDD